jgi:hypothetical protein
MTEQLVTGESPVPRVALRRTRMTLGPYLVPITDEDRASGRATVAISVTFDPPGTGDDSAAKALQERLAQVVGGPVPGSLRGFGEHLFDALARPGRPGQGDAALVDAGFRLTQVAVALLPRGVAADSPPRPLVVVTVEADERA